MDAGDPRVRALTPVWISLLVFVTVYGVIAWFVIRGHVARTDRHVSTVVVIALYAAGAGSFGASFLVSRLIARAARASTPNAPTAYRPITESSRTAIIVRWTLMETAAIFGLVAAFITGNRIVFLPLGVIAFLGILLSPPSADRLRNMAGPSRTSG